MPDKAHAILSQAASETVRMLETNYPVRATAWIKENAIRVYIHQAKFRNPSRYQATIIFPLAEFRSVPESEWNDYECDIDMHIYFVSQQILPSKPVLNAQISQIITGLL